MARKRKVTGGILAVVGFMLSPLSWWNDAFVNFPLAIAFAWLVSSFFSPDKREGCFRVCVVVGYWLTNIAGLVLLHKGAEKMILDESKRYTLRAFLRDAGISLLYTGVIVALLEYGVLKPIQGYLK